MLANSTNSITDPRYIKCGGPLSETEGRIGGTNLPLNAYQNRIKPLVKCISVVRPLHSCNRLLRDASSMFIFNLFIFDETNVNLAISNRPCLKYMHAYASERYQ